jgi:hypothetical protein
MRENIKNSTYEQTISYKYLLHHMIFINDAFLHHRRMLAAAYILDTYLFDMTGLEIIFFQDKCSI